MTQPPPPLPPDPDELASAIVDGLLSADQAEAARRDPAVARRVDDLLRVRAAVQATPPPPPAAADRAVAAALEAFEASPRPMPPPAPADPTRPPLRVLAHTPGAGVPAPRPATPGRWSRPAPWLAAAAALLVFGLAMTAVLRQNSQHSNPDSAASESTGDESATEESSSEDASGGGDVAAEAPTVPSDAGLGVADVALPQLGSVADAAELQGRVSENLTAGQDASQRAGTSAGSAQPRPDESVDDQDCAGLTPTGDPTRGTQTFVADATVDGEPVRVHIYLEQSGQQRLVATNISCEDVVDRPYTG
jgi:hypothetical protein